MKHLVTVALALVCATSFADGRLPTNGVFVPDIGNFGPNNFPAGDLGTGTYLGRDLFMLNSSPQVSWFQTSYSRSWGYNFFENATGQLELNSINADGSNPETLCALDFRGGTYFNLSCVQGIQAQGALSTNGLIQIYNASGNADEKTWWFQNASSSVLALKLVNEPQTDSQTLITFQRSGYAPAAVGIEGGANLNVSGAVDAGTLIVGGGTPINSSVRTTVSAVAPSRHGCSDISISLPGATVGSECIVGAPPVVDNDATWSCYVSSPGAAVLRLCCHNEPCACSQRTYSVRTIGP